MSSFEEANKEWHNVEEEWHFSHLIKYGFFPDRMWRQGFVREFIYTHPILKNKILASVGAHADYWSDELTGARGYWSGLPPFLKTLMENEGIKISEDNLQLQSILLVEWMKSIYSEPDQICYNIKEHALKEFKNKLTSIKLDLWCGYIDLKTNISTGVIQKIIDSMTLDNILNKISEIIFNPEMDLKYNKKIFLLEMIKIGISKDYFQIDTLYNFNMGDFDITLVENFLHIIVIDHFIKNPTSTRPHKIFLDLQEYNWPIEKLFKDIEYYSDLDNKYTRKLLELERNVSRSEIAEFKNKKKNIIKEEYYLKNG